MSTVNGGQLRHAMNQVHMKENFEEEIIMNVRTQMADGTYRRNSFKRNMVSAAACLLVIGTVSIPAYAGTRECDYQRQSNGKDAGGSRRRGTGYL